MAEAILKKTRKISEKSLANLRPQKAGEPGHNKAGRPKKADCLIGCIKAELERKSVNGTSTNEQLIAAALVSMATKGNVKAIELLMSYTTPKPRTDIALSDPDGKALPVPTFIFAMPDGTQRTAKDLATH